MKCDSNNGHRVELSSYSGQKGVGTSWGEYFTIRYNLNFKTGSRKSNRSQLQNKHCGRLGHKLEPQLVSLRDKCPWDTHPKRYSYNTIPTPKAQGTWQKDGKSPKHQEACSDIKFSRHDRETTSMKLLQYGCLNRPWRMIPQVGIPTWRKFHGAPPLDEKL